MQKIRIGIIGGAGYTAGELIRILLNHPEAEIRFIHSISHSGEPVTSVHDDLLGETPLLFSDDMDLPETDVLFLCQGHGKSRSFLDNHPLPDSVKVIARMLSGFASVSRKIFAIRVDNNCVLPVPGPAITKTGPAILSTACRCAAFNWS